MSIQLQVEWLIPTINSLSLEALQLQSKIALKEAEIEQIPWVMVRKAEIMEMKKALFENQKKESELREQGKQIMLNNDMKEISMLDWTTISLHFTPWALVVEDDSVIPDEFWKEKTTRDVDKTALKKAISEWKFENEKVYIQKDCKFVIKQK